MALLTCHDLRLGYDNKTVLDHVELTINPGDYLCIVGENGSGKSTLIKTLLRLTPPLGGQITLGDGLKPNQIGYLPQQTEIQRDFPASVGEIVQSGCLNRCGLRPFYNRQEKQLAAQAMQKLGIAPLANRCYRELSGGQQQRVLLARALCATRVLLLLDEPVTGLDPVAAADLYALISELNQQGLAILMITHDIAAACAHAKQIMHLGHHRPLFYGPVQDYLNSPISAAYVDHHGEVQP